MNSLRSKLLLTFIAVSLAGTAIAFLVVRWTSQRAFADLVAEQRQRDFVQNVLVHYQDRGSWEGVERAIMARIPPAPPGQPATPPPPFALANANGRIVFAQGSFRRGMQVPPSALAEGVALELDGAQIGTVLPLNLAPPRNPAEEVYLRRTNRALLLGGIGATLAALVLAIILARALARPLQELAQASRAMAQGQLQQKVPVRTSDELGELAAAFNQMSAALALANRQRRQMTADIAHDLRTPLTVLAGYLEAMQDGTLPPNPARLALMQEEVGVLQRLVADLRTLSLADAGTLRLKVEPVPPSDLLAQVVAARAPQAAHTGVTLAVDASPDLPYVVLDPARMRQVLGNLVDNALRYTPTGGTVTLGAQVDNRQLALTVTDTGSGIAPADLPHIFDRFYRGDRARQEGSGASGLGLAIVKSLVRLHDGEITAASPPPGAASGTRFSVHLPLRD